MTEALERRLFQTAPWPDDLAVLVEQFRYKPGWTFRLVADLERDFEPEDTARERCIGWGTTLVITSLTYNSYRDYSYRDAPDYRVNHYKIVPAATFNRGAWARWLLDQCIEVEVHEACEFARFDEGGAVRRPFAPLHGLGENPYVVHEYASDAQRRTSFRGEMSQ